VPDPRSQARSRSRSHEREEEAVNRGNTLYVTGLSSRVTEREIKDYFSKEGRVVGCHVVLEPHTRVSRGFAFVTMDTVEEADRCIKYLNNSVMKGRNITVEKKILCKICAAIKILSSSISALANYSSISGQPKELLCTTRFTPTKCSNYSTKPELSPSTNQRAMPTH